MPRKMSDYDEDYEDYNDYDDNDYDREEKEKIPEAKEETKGCKLWRCPICAYNNEDGFSACDICGVLRDPLVKNINTCDDRIVLSSDVNKEGANDATLTSKSAHGSSTVLPSSKLGSVGDTKLSTKSSDSSSTTIRKSALAIEEHNTSINVTENLQSSGNRSSSTSTSKSAGKIYSMDENSNPSVERENPQSLARSLNNLVLNVKSAYANYISGLGKTSDVQYKHDQWMLPDKAVDTLTQLNLAIVGHVDSGKSTLSGRLLHLLGRVSKKEMHKYEKESKSLGKGSFAYAWALDESTEERERGITMNVGVAYFDSKSYHVVVLDSPGHKDFVPNLISGATQADAAVLVIDASVGAFEAGMDSSKGQTREHVKLIRSFGVDQIIVVVNKMDVVQYSKDRYDFITQQVGKFCRTCGYKDSSLILIPLSAMANQNLVAAPSDSRLLSWYRGPNFLEAIDSLQPPSRDFSKPLLMPICDAGRSHSLGQVSACGKLAAGALKSGSKVLVMPSGDKGTVRSLECNSQAWKIARAGDSVTVSLQGVEASSVMAGGVLCHPDFPVAVAKHLELKIVTLEFASPILFGSQLEIHVHHVKEAARVTKIVSLLDSKTGKVAKKSPRCLSAKQSAVIEVVLQSPVCVEVFSTSRALGRVFLRAMGRTIAVGVVTQLIGDTEQ